MHAAARAGLNRHLLVVSESFLHYISKNSLNVLDNADPRQSFATLHNDDRYCQHVLHLLCTAVCTSGSLLCMQRLLSCKFR